MTALAHTHAANPHWLPATDRAALAALPGEDGWPVIGNTLAMLRDPAAFGRRMMAQYGPVYRNHAFGTRTVMLLGADAVELVLFDRDRLFSSEQGWGPLLNLLFPRGLMLMDFDRHRADRRALGVAFKLEPMRHYAHRLDQGIARAVEGWADRPLRFYDAIKQLSLDLAADCFLGIELGNEAVRMNRAFVDEVQASVAPARRPWPGTRMRRGVKARAWLVDWFAREVPRRRAAGGQDFFSHFCRATDEAGALLDASVIADHMNFLMMAAHDTITSSATSLVQRLGEHPDWQERLAAEVATMDAGRWPEQLDRLVLTDYAFRESLRLMPPVPSLPRRALRAFEWGGHHIPAGTAIGISVGHTHYDPAHWPDPARFDPLRFTPDGSRGRHRYAWVPFGGGAHMCLGLHFATMQVRLLLAHLLSRYRIEPAPGAGAAWQIFPIPRPRDGLPLRFVRA